jgi:hypothetical protein
MVSGWLGITGPTARSVVAVESVDVIEHATHRNMAARCVSGRTTKNGIVPQTNVQVSDRIKFCCLHKVNVKFRVYFQRNLALL